MKILTIIMMLFFFFIVSSKTFASTSPDLEAQTQAEDLSLVLEAFDASQTGKAWGWDLIRVRTVLDVGIEIPFITNFTVSPEIEFFFTKK